MRYKTELRGFSARMISAILAFLTVAALFLPLTTLGLPEVNALPNNTEYTPDDTYLSGSDFSELSEGVLTGEKGATTDSKVYIYKNNGKTIYQATPKKSIIKVVSEDGNKFIRYERAANGTGNDVYMDYYDTQKDIYTGDFVVEISIRLMDYPEESGALNLIQFINRDEGNKAITGSDNDNLFQRFLSMQKDGSVQYAEYNPSTNKDKNVSTGYVVTPGEWTHFSVAVHRNETERDTMDVFINGALYAEDVPLTYPINSIHQMRICHTDGKSTAACVVDLDNVWIYKGSAPAITVGSGAGENMLVGALDYSDPTLAVGSTVRGKVTTSKFEIDAKSDLFSVHKDTWRTLLKMDQSKGSPYVDVYANGARGALVADMALILGSDWNGSADILSPFAESDGYVSRESFLSVDSSSRLIDKSGNVLAELGGGVNRIAIAFSADRGYASVFVNGKHVSTIEAQYGSAYKKLGGIRFLEFEGAPDSGTAYLYYADIYRGSMPAVSLGNITLEYRHDFDGVEDISEIAPITFIGSATLLKKTQSGEEIFAACALNRTAVAGSAVRYDESIDTSAISLSFVLNADLCDNIDVLRFGNTPILSGDGGRLFLNTADGAKPLFKTEYGREYQMTVTVEKSTVTVYADGLPFVQKAALPEGAPEKAEYIDFLYVTESGEHSAYIDSLEIYTGGSPFVGVAQLPILADTSAVDHKAVLSWQGLGKADGYRIYKSLAENGEYSDISGLITDAEYTDSDVVIGNKYYYRIGAVIIWGGEEIVLGLDGAPIVFEDVDPGLNVIATGFGGGISLSWDAFHAVNLGYSVYRAFSEDGEYELVAEKITGREYSDTTVVPGLGIYYKVCVVLERDGREFVFGFDQTPVYAIAGEVEAPPEEPADPDEPTDPDEPSDGEVIKIPDGSSEKTIEENFEGSLGDNGEITVVGSGFKTEAVNDVGNVLSFRGSALSEQQYIAAKQSFPVSKSLLMDMKLCINSAKSTVYLLSPVDANGVLFNMMEAKTEQNSVTVYLGDSVGGEDKAIASFKMGEWHRLTVWVDKSGEKAAIFMDGVCLIADAALPSNEDGALISNMSAIHLLSVGENESLAGDTASPIDDSSDISVYADDFTVHSSTLFATAFTSVYLAPKVTVNEKENHITWNKIAGVLYYTVWRAVDGGDYTVIATELQSTEYTDSYDKDCSYKITYTYDKVGVELVSLPSASGTLAKKPVIVEVAEVVTKLIDLSKPGTVGILVVTGGAILAIVAIYVIRTFVLKVEPIQPNRIKEDSK